MEQLAAVYAAAFTPFVVAALFGGILGAAASADVKTFGFRLTLILSLMTLGAVGAGSNYLTTSYPNAGIFWHFLEGGIVGLIGLKFLDALRAASPVFTSKLVDIASNSLLDNITALIDKLTKLSK